jgi:predicted MFS family arabinose efflux permease
VVDAPALSYSSAPGRWVVAITVLGSGIAALDATVVNIALPTIGRDFHTGIAALQWVMTSYILTLAAFLLIGGSLGDRFGRRKVYLLGVVWFALASAACGFAPNADFLIITRVLQGIGGALLTPGSLAILEASFRPVDRARAIGAWSGLGGVAIAAGPLIGGYLISAASWRWIFFINIPIAAVVVALGARHVPESRDPGATGRLDYAGALAAVVFLTGVTFAFIEAPALGWASPAVLQVVSGYSPLASGLALLPLTIIMLALSARSGQLAARIGPRLQLSVGPVVVGAGLAMLTFAVSGAGYAAHVLPAIVVFGLGIAITVAPLTSVAMSSAPAQHAGIASAVNNDLSRFGGLLAVAILPALAGITGQAYLHPDALAAGFKIAVLISGGLCAAAGLLAAVTITNPRREPQPADTPGYCLHCALDALPLRAALGGPDASTTGRSG